MGKCSYEITWAILVPVGIMLWTLAAGMLWTFSKVVLKAFGDLWEAMF